MSQKITSTAFEVPRLRLPFSEILKSVPEIFGAHMNEEPKYRVIESAPHRIEVREYQPQVTASVTLGGLDYDEFKDQAFRRLAYYIFGGNRSNRQIEMTAPVLQRSKSSPGVNLAMTAPVLQKKTLVGEWTMSFILPANLNLETAPQPLDPGIQLASVAASQIAAIRYSGINTVKKMAEHERILRAWLETRSDSVTDGEVFSAQYDPPFALPFVRRNDVMLRLASSRR